MSEEPPVGGEFGGGVRVDVGSSGGVVGAASVVEAYASAAAGAAVSVLLSAGGVVGDRLRDLRALDASAEAELSRSADEEGGDDAVGEAAGAGGASVMVSAEVMASEAEAVAGTEDRLRDFCCCSDAPPDGA